MIPLQNLQQRHIGFLLPAGLPEDYRTAAGAWEGDCVFMALPAQAELFTDPAYLALAAHQDAGEHRIHVTSDGTTLSLRAVAPSGASLFVRLPSSGLGEWGTGEGATEEQLGCAVRVSDRAA